MRVARHRPGATHMGLLVMLAVIALMVGLTARDGWAGTRILGTLVVTVQGSDGKTAADADVTIRYTKKRGGVVQRDGKTDVHGVATFRELADAHWTITAKKDGKTGQAAADVTKRTQARVTVRLTAASATSSNSTRKSGNLIVTVQEPNGKAAVNADVLIRLPGKGKKEGRHSGKTDQLGKVTFSEIEIGNWLITATEEGHKRGSDTARLKAGETVRVQVVMKTLK